MDDAARKIRAHRDKGERAAAEAERARVAAFVARTGYEVEARDGRVVVHIHGPARDVGGLTRLSQTWSVDVGVLSHAIAAGAIVRSEIVRRSLEVGLRSGPWTDDVVGAVMAALRGVAPAATRVPVPDSGPRG